MLPLLLWSYVGLFVYWDCFRSLNTMQKASYTVSDMLSRDRSTNGITSAYITGLHKVLEYLIDKDQNASMRVTSVYWSGTNADFEVHWSRTTNTTVLPELSTATLQNYIGQIPTMNVGDTAVIVEVRAPFVPVIDVGLFNAGIGNQVFSQFIVTRPRFHSCIVMDGILCPL